MSVATVNVGLQRYASSCSRPPLMCYAPACQRHSSRCRHQIESGHDTVNDLEGFGNDLRGLEPRRYVIIRPASAPSVEEPSISSMEEADDRSGEPADLS